MDDELKRKPTGSDGAEGRKQEIESLGQIIPQKKI
jgi:hypothetical protein